MDGIGDLASLDKNVDGSVDPKLARGRPGAEQRLAIAICISVNMCTRSLCCRFRVLLSVLSVLNDKRLASGL